MDREPHMPMPRLVLVLSENWTLVDPRDLRGLVELAVVAEAAGIDAVMMSEHIVLGASAGANGIMANPRDYAAPGNQDPAMPWPSSLLVLAAAAQATATLRLIAGAVIAPLRHPLLLAKELGTLDLLSEGRLVVLPTVSWHRDEYDALGVSYGERGRILDEQLEVLAASWGPGPIRHEGTYYSFDDVWLEPRAYRPEGPTMWFGGQGMHPPLLRRLVRYGHGFNPFGSVADADLAMLRAAMTDAGRPLSSLEMVGGIRGTFPDDRGPADLDTALRSLPGQLERGYTTICFKPAMFIDEATQLDGFCRELVRKVGDLAT
jgi:alkanesulfonate monooxygenase SsuD/methylene tetrahydromethanopterin reductase-like flavin-dependent oxidoreductase (luciferase family)